MLTALKDRRCPAQLSIRNPHCVATISRVRRNPSNAVVNPSYVSMVDINPIDAANEHTSGMVVTSAGQRNTL